MRPLNANPNPLRFISFHEIKREFNRLIGKRQPFPLPADFTQHNEPQSDRQISAQKKPKYSILERLGALIGKTGVFEHFLDANNPLKMGRIKVLEEKIGKSESTLEVLELKIQSQMKNPSVKRSERKRLGGLIKEAEHQLKKLDRYELELKQLRKDVLKLPVPINADPYEVNQRAASSLRRTLNDAKLQYTRLTYDSKMPVKDHFYILDNFRSRFESILEGQSKENFDAVKSEYLLAKSKIESSPIHNKLMKNQVNNIMDDCDLLVDELVKRF